MPEAPMTLTPQGSRNPTAAMAEPATASQPTNSVTRAASRSSSAHELCAVAAPDTASWVAGWPAHARAGAGGPAGSADRIGGTYAPGASGIDRTGATGRTPSGEGPGIA